MIEPEEAFKIISRGLRRRLEVLEARATETPPRPAIVVYPTGASADEREAFEKALAERKRATPQRTIIVVGTSIPCNTKKEV